MARMKGADLITEYLVGNKIPYVFGICGHGNVGMLDIVQALHWVKDNIERFGGDPRTVMIFGESGGARKVSVMMAFEPGAGLFHRAAVQSGSALRVDKPEIAAERGEKMMKVLGLARTDLDRLVATPLPDLIRAGSAVQPDMNQFRPVLDGRAIKRHPFDPDAPARNIRIPMPTGLGDFRGKNNVALLLPQQLAAMLDSAMAGIRGKLKLDPPPDAGCGTISIPTFSIPALTIIAMILIMIVMILLSLIGFALQLRICLPFSLKAKN